MVGSHCDTGYIHDCSNREWSASLIVLHVHSVGSDVSRCVYLTATNFNRHETSDKESATKPNHNAHNAGNTVIHAQGTRALSVSKMKDQPWSVGIDHPGAQHLLLLQASLIIVTQHRLLAIAS